MTPCKRKTITWKTKPYIKKIGQGQKESERERSKSKYWLVCMREKQKNNYIPLGGKYTLFIAKLMFSHSYAD